MKIKQLLEAHSVNYHQSRSSSDEVGDQRVMRANMLKSRNVLGTGTEGVVFEKPSRHTVTKIHQGTKDLASFLAYANQHPYDGNPLLPKVYKITQIRDNLYKFDMERLHSFDPEEDFNTTVMLLNQWVKSEVVDEFVDTLPGRDKYFDVWDVINLIDQAIDNPEQLTKNARQAIELIRQYNPKGPLDTTPGNLMLRRTSVGPQLVFADPVHTGSYVG